MKAPKSNDGEVPVFPVKPSVGADAVYPVPAGRSKTLVPGPWMPGDAKPARKGRYLRYFDDVEDCAYSEFDNGRWLRDGFFESDVQNAPWRGGVRRAA